MDSPPTYSRVSDLKIAEGNGKLQLTLKYILKLNSDHVMYRIEISDSEKYIDTFRYQQKIKRYDIISIYRPTLKSTLTNDNWT